MCTIFHDFRIILIPYTTNPETNFVSGFKPSLRTFVKYCRSFIYENARCLYIPEMKVMFSLVKEAICTGNTELLTKENISKACEKYRDEYFKTPLSMIIPESFDLSKLLYETADIIDNMDFSY